MHLIFVLFSLVAAGYSVSVSSFATNICSEPMNAAAESFVETLERLAAQHKAGSIDDSEFEQRKLQVLSAFDLPKTYSRAPKAVVALSVTLANKQVGLLLAGSLGLVAIILIAQAAGSKNYTNNAEYSAKSATNESPEYSSTMNDSPESSLQCRDEVVLFATFLCVGQVVEIADIRSVVRVPSGASQAVRTALQGKERDMRKKCQSPQFADEYSRSLALTINSREIYDLIEGSGNFNQDTIKMSCFSSALRLSNKLSGGYVNPQLADR